MFLPAVEVLECGGQRLNHQFITRIEMFVETADGNTGLPHHVGNADAFEAEFAKPLRRNPHDTRVCLRLIPLRRTHLPSPPLQICRMLSYSTTWRHHGPKSSVVL